MTEDRPSNRRVLAGAVASGILCGLGCPSSFLPLTAPAAWIWAVPFLVTARGASATQFIGGAMLAGVLGAIGTTTGAGAALGYLGVVYFAVAGLFYAAPYILLAPLRRWMGHDRALWALPALSALTEWLLFRMELGWNNLAGSQANAVGLIQFADLFGQTSITFWLMLMNVLVYREVVRGDEWRLRARRIAAVFVLVLGIPAAYSFYRLHQSYGSGRPLDVLLVQPNLDSRLDSPRDGALTALKTLFAITDAAAFQRKPDLIVWPEGAVQYVLSRYSPVREAMTQAVADWGTPLVTGALDEARSTTRARRFFVSADFANASILFTPGPPGAGADRVRMAEPYHKRRLVPFIEGAPFGLSRKWLKKLHAHPDRGYSLERGHTLRLLTYRADSGQMVQFAAPICYENMYGSDFAEFVRRGAQFFIVVTNDSWFGRWETAYSHAALARVRAIETRRPVAQAATTGLSLLIDARGVVITAAPWWQPAIVRAAIQPNDSLTFYALHPNLFPALCGVWLVGYLLFGATEGLWEVLWHARGGRIHALKTLLRPGR